MKIPPLEVIASWPRPNYINPVSRASTGRIIGSTVLALVTIVLAIRLYSRKRLTRGFGLDDTLICLAYIPASAFTIVGVVSQDVLQWGRHIWDVEPKFLNSNILIILIHLFLFDLATSLTKLSMLAMLRRLTSASRSKAEHAVVLILAALITANCSIFIIVEIFQCWPISSAWELSEISAYCIDEPAHLMAANIINTVTDFIVVLLPIRTTMALKLPPRQRVIVTGLFSIGLIASAVGIARTYFSWVVFSAAGDYDTTWRSWYVWLTSLIELHLGIICASIPATKPFFARYVSGMAGLAQKRRDCPVLGPEPLAPWIDEHNTGQSGNTTVSSLSLSVPDPENETHRLKYPPPVTARESFWGRFYSLAGSTTAYSSP